MLPEPPEMDVLVDRAEAAFVGLPGCHELGLHVEQTNGAGVLGKTSFVLEAKGRLQDGHWGPLHYSITSRTNSNVNVNTDVDGQSYPFLLPLLGSFGGTDSVVNESRNLLVTVLASVKGGVEGDWVGVETWEGREHYRLERGLKDKRTLFGKTRSDTVQVLFEPDTLQPRVWRTELENPISHHGLRMKHLDVTLELAPDGTPRAETLALRGGFGVMALTVARSIRYEVLGSCTTPDAAPIDDPIPLPMDPPRLE